MADPVIIDASGQPLKPKFENVFCSQCGNSFGPGEHGFSHCRNHKGMRRYPDPTAPGAKYFLWAR